MALAAATIATLPLGSIYAFSVLVTPLEQLLGASRTGLASVFGISAVFFTVGANLGPRLFGRLRAPVLLGLTGTLAAAGVVLAAVAPSLSWLIFGYGLLFATGGGMVYIVVQQCVNAVPLARPGLVNGYLVSLFNVRMDGVVYRRLQGAAPKAFLGLAFRRSDPSPVLKRVVDLIRSIAKRHPPIPRSAEVGSAIGTDDRRCYGGTLLANSRRCAYPDRPAGPTRCRLEKKRGSEVDVRLYTASTSTVKQQAALNALTIARVTSLRLTQA